ncbi:MAG: [FeFe] hydrogenase H-cluster maturation GTPase HydF [Spirochaetes bacterium]|nr:[FeFe] hydrogenase H-cluster maturation GTPase HydF [Spirochaetota bacterium]
MKAADALRIKIVLLGLRNTGKSSLMNNLFGKDVAIVSNIPGTTTDPVSKAMELDELGPVSVIDTAGLDDEGDIGKERIKKTLEKIENADIHLLVSRIDKEPAESEVTLAETIAKKNGILIIVLTFADKSANPLKLEWAKKYPHCTVNNLSKDGIEDFKKSVISLKEKITFEITPLEGIVKEGDLLLMVTPIDASAPKGRLIMPQVETIRDSLDKNCGTLVIKEHKVKFFYDSLKIKPALVITDSQAFHEVAANIPQEQKLTSFSILYARKKGDLSEFVEGLAELKKYIDERTNAVAQSSSQGCEASLLPSNTRVLVLEACSHHAKEEDIGTVKIPALFRKLIDKNAEFEFLKSLPERENLLKYSVIIHCGACMITRTAMVSRLEKIKESGVPIVNYGLFLAWANKLLPRALEPFSEIYSRWKDFEFVIK